MTQLPTAQGDCFWTCPFLSLPRFIICNATAIVPGLQPGHPSWFSIVGTHSATSIFSLQLARAEKRTVSASDPAYVLLMYDTGLRAKFRRHTSQTDAGAILKYLVESGAETPSAKTFAPICPGAD